MSAPLRQTDFSLILDDFRPSSSAPLPAKISAAPTPRAKASKGSARASTSKPSALSESAALVGSLLRTALISELGALTPSSLRWRQSATPAGRSWFVLATSEPTTSDPAAGSSGATLHKLPTPMASDGMKDGAGGGSGSTYPFRQILATPRASDMKAGGHGDTGRMGTVRHQLTQAILPTPRASDASHGPEMTKVRGDKITGMNLRTVMHPAAQQGQTSDRWDYARQIAAMLTEAGLIGPSATLPITYGWMMGYPPGWLGRALMSAMAKGSLRLASSSKRSATRSDATAWLDALRALWRRYVTEEGERHGVR